MTVGAEDDVAPLSPVSAVRAAVDDALVVEKGSDAVASVSRLDLNLRSVDKHL